MTDQTQPTGSGVVLQVSGDDPALVAKGLQSAKNLLAEIDPAPVEIVVQGAAVEGLVADSEQAKKLPDAPDGVTILACRNALRAHHVAEKSLAPEVTVVPAGIAWVVKRQRDGWSYVRI